MGEHPGACMAQPSLGLSGMCSCKAGGWVALDCRHLCTRRCQSVQKSNKRSCARSRLCTPYAPCLPAPLAKVLQRERLTPTVHRVPAGGVVARRTQLLHQGHPNLLLHAHSFCVCACVRVCTHAHAHVHACMCMRVHAGPAMSQRGSWQQRGAGRAACATPAHGRSDQRRLIHIRFPSCASTLHPSQPRTHTHGRSVRQLLPRVQWLGGRCSTGAGPPIHDTWRTHIHGRGVQQLPPQVHGLVDVE